VEPRIQYAKTADGVSIAFSTLGEGTPLVYMSSMPLAYMQMEWQFSDWRRWHDRLASKRMVVHYDSRGWGLSGRDVADYSLDAHLLDLEAVVERLGLERFALLGQLNLGPVAIAYAARHPERVSHLLLWCSWARASDFYKSPRLGALRELLRSDWELYTETMGHLLFGFSDGEPAHQAAVRYRENVTPEVFRIAVDALRRFDVAGLLPQVKSPTLVLHRRQAQLLDVNVARELAAQIPNARLVLLEGSVLWPSSGDVEAEVQAIDEFLGEGEEPAAAPAEAAAPGGFRTILFTDVEGSTALTQRLGDAKSREVLRESERIVREALRAHGGSEVKTMGDGFMASFSSATRALECGIAMQRAFAEHNESAGEPIRVRIGLNAGEPIAEAEDLFGTAVNLAARIAAQAEGGEIMASDVVRQLVAGKGFLFSDRGDVALRGFEDPVRLYEVRWREET
jgi:class 3 adenylate cyclase